MIVQLRIPVKGTRRKIEKERKKLDKAIVWHMDVSANSKSSFPF